MAKARRTLILLVAAGLAACGSRTNDTNTVSPEVEAIANALEPLEELANVSRNREPSPWERDELPTDLRTALVDDLRYLGADHIGYRGMGDAQMCRTLQRIGLPCNYSTRMTLVRFLAVNGQDIFPSDDDRRPDRPSTAYYGTAEQNQRLRREIARNAHLFRNGNLTAENARRWRS